MIKNRDLDKIKLLTGMEAIRKRPALYLGPLDDILIPNRLLREALCCARDEALQGHCHSVTIRLARDGFATLRDDGPGLPLEMGPCGRRKAEMYLTSVHAGCAAGKSSEEIARTTCQLTLAVLNALSSELTVRIFADGSEWHQDYREGEATGPLVVVGTTAIHGTELSFRLDGDILENLEFDFAEFTKWVRDNVIGLEVTIDDTRSDQSITVPAIHR